jgi:hypothetical protein
VKSSDSRQQSLHLNNPVANFEFWRVDEAAAKYRIRMPSQVRVSRRRSRRDDDESDEYEAATQQPSSSAKKNGVIDEEIERMARRLVRLALSLEHARLPIRRDAIVKDVLQGASSRCFAAVFTSAQEKLKDTFGMQLEELPAKDKKKGMSMTQMRKQAHRQATQASRTGTQGPLASQRNGKNTAQKSWALQTLLSPELRSATMGVFVKDEALYNTVSGVLLVLVSMSPEQTCSSTKLEGYLRRVGWQVDTPAGKLEEVLKQMRKQGYLDSCKDDSATEAGATLHFLGPRGKAESVNNVKGLTALVQKLYNAEPGSAAAKKVEQSIKGTFEVAMEDGAEDDEYEQE